MKIELSIGHWVNNGYSKKKLIRVLRNLRKREREKNIAL